MRRRVAVPLLVLAVLAAACGGDAASDPGSDTEEGTPTAFASIFALSWIAEQVAPDVELTALGAGGDPHDVDLSSEQREAIGASDVVLYLGDIEFQPQVEEAVADSSGQVVSATEVVGEEALREAVEDEEHAEEEEEEEGEAHAEPTVDPHLWFSAALMSEVAEAAGAAFAEADPGGAEEYRANGVRVAAELAELDADLAELFDDCERDEAVVSHEAYGYLLDPHGKSQVGIAGLAPEAGATSADIAGLVDQIEAEGITTVLAEPEEGRADAEALAEETGIDLVEINPLESVGADEAEEGYPALLRRQAEGFAGALGCA